MSSADFNFPAPPFCEEAYAAHDLQLQYIKVDPHFDSLRGEARFQELVRRVGLPQ
ncbi:MAG TPA: hypothetical protein VM870_02285 [Pyrinomonadaceae bacterium]|nr:hypothetical protein [Pyrinomonadaceae bacterium]